MKTSVHRLLTVIQITAFVWFAGGRPDEVLGQAPAYTATDLGTLGGNSSTAYGINNRWQVVGTSSISTASGAPIHATLFSGTGMGNIDLGDLNDGVGSFSVAYGINDSGQIVGRAIRPDFQRYAVLYTGNGVGNVDLGNLGSALSTATTANAINNSGQIIGASAPAASAIHATRFSGIGTGNIDLHDGPFGAGSIAYSINNSGQTVGYGPVNNMLNSSSAVIFTGPGSFSLGTLGGGLNGAALGNNDNGQIVGWATTSSGAQHAALFSGTGNGNTDLGVLGGTSGISSIAFSINNSGLIVGNARLTVAGSEEVHGFLYSGGTMYDLYNNFPNAIRVTLTQVQTGFIEGGRRINDFGQIAARGLVNFQDRALRLDPVNPLTITSAGGSIINTKFIGGMNFNLFPTSTDPGNLGTTVSLLGGIAGNGGFGQFGLNRDFNVAFIPRNPILPLSSSVDITGTEADTFVLQLSYDQALVTSLLGDEANARLGWLNSGIWGLAVDGNDGGIPSFVMGPWNSSHGLGTHGVDVAANTVWAVVNHNSNFAVWGVPNDAVPDTEGTLDIFGFDFFGFAAVNPGPNQVSFLEIIYDGSSPIIMNTFFNNANGFDTEIGLYDSAGNLIVSNDNANLTLQSRLVLKDLPAGTYYLAAGLFNTTFGATNFNATSTAGSAASFRVDALTFSENIIAGDVNGDGLVNLLDINPFVNALVSDTYIPEADVNCDSVVNLLDVNPFVALFSGP